MSRVPRRTVRCCLTLLLIVVGARTLTAQKPADITGTWRVDAGTDTKNGPREVIIRADSSASWGKETVRWRLKDDRISIVLGGEWETYKIRVTRRRADAVRRRSAEGRDAQKGRSADAASRAMPGFLTIRITRLCKQRVLGRSSDR